MSLGERIKKLRLENKLTQEGLAKKLNLSKSNISKYESNDVEPNISTLRAMSKLFNVPTDYLVGETDKKSIDEPIDEPYDSLAEITKITDKLGIERLGFLDVEEWKNLGPEEVAQIEQHFEFMVQHAKMKKEQEAKKEK